MFFKKLHPKNNHPVGENSPYLVTLPARPVNCGQIVIKRYIQTKFIIPTKVAKILL
jgi:hypothetical protein